MATSKIPLVPGTKTLARGSVVIGNASGEPSALAIGSNTYVLKSDGTDISWGADAAGTITAFTNGVDDRVVTATSATALNGEANLTFAANVLAMIVPIDTASILRMSGNRGLAGESLGSVEYQWDGTPVCKITGTSGSDTTNKDDGNLSFYTRTSGESITERMRINKDGIVGIGAYLDGDLGVGLHIKTADSGGTSLEAGADELVIEGSGPTGMTILSGNTHSGNINFADNDAASRGIINYDHTDDKMVFYTGGLGTITMGDSGGTSTDTILNLQSANTATDFIMLRINSGTGEQAKVLSNGNMYNTNNVYAAISDERIKQNITDASSQWDDIKALKVRNFKLKSDTTKTHIGVVAQELETANMNGLIEENRPTKEDIVHSSDFGTIEAGTEDNGATPIKDDDGNITGYEDVFNAGQKVKAVKYSILYMKAIKCLQEAMEKIETLEAKVTALENK